MGEQNQQAVEHLQGYHTALITTAVTGQIDVRDWQVLAAVEDPELEVA